MIKAFNMICFMFLLVTSLLSAVGHARSEQAIIGVASVIDGDTLEIHGERIRLHGIDAPESRQTCLAADGDVWPCGRRSANALAEYLGRRTITCLSTARDRYRRAIAVCTLNNHDINKWLVSTGYAVAYRLYSLDYVQAENEAREAKRGMWAGKFVYPWDWRKGVRLERTGAVQQNRAREQYAWVDSTAKCNGFKQT